MSKFRLYEESLEAIMNWRTKEDEFVSKRTRVRFRLDLMDEAEQKFWKERAEDNRTIARKLGLYEEGVR